MANTVLVMVMSLSLAWSELGVRAAMEDMNAKQSESGETIALLMPSVQPQRDDTYLCYERKLGDTLYITGFDPKAKMEVTHHMLLYGCAEPVGTEEPWDCGEMHSSDSKYKRGPVCKTPGSVIYAWGMDAPDLKLPENVGFKVGRNSGVKSLVIQVHYKDASSFLPPENGKDHSGVILTTTTVPQAKTAGVYLLASNGQIPPHSTTYMDTACPFDESLTLHPFAFRVHAHEHGQVVSGYRVRDGQWTELGRESPQKPQMFYQMAIPDLTIEKGDILAARCTMINNGDTSVHVGTTSKDEMCNFYMMYFINGDKVVQEPICYSPGPPSWNWNSVDGIHPENAPLTASMMPDSDTILRETEKHIKQVNNAIRLQQQKMDSNFKNFWKNSAHRHANRMNFDELKPVWDESVLSNEFGNQYPFDSDEDQEPWSNKYELDDQMDNLNLPIGDDYYQPVQGVDDISMPSMVDMPTSDIDLEFPNIDVPIPDMYESEKPSETETMAIIDDKNGGKGFEKTRHVFKHLKIPNGKGYVKSSHKESSYSWNSDSSKPKNENT